MLLRYVYSTGVTYDRHLELMCLKYMAPIQLSLTWLTPSPNLAQQPSPNQAQIESNFCGFGETASWRNDAAQNVKILSTKVENINDHCLCLKRTFYQEYFYSSLLF
jgi:hypothetical protein